MSGYYKSQNSYRSTRPAEDSDPMSAMSNVGDVMLVFACGLMIALVAAWNVDLSQYTQVETESELDQDAVTEMEDQLYGEGSSFVEMGTVYQDPTTGKYYLVEDEGSSTSGSAASSAATPADGDASTTDSASITGSESAADSASTTGSETQSDKSQSGGGGA